MAYGLIYYSEFDNVGEHRYRFEILQKDYAGSSSSVLLSGNPATHRWDTDDVKAPIKGSSLVVNLLNGTSQQGTFGATVELDFVDQGIFYQSIILISGTTFIPQVGVPFTVSGHVDPSVNGVYTPLSFVQTGTNSYTIVFAVGADQPTSVADESTITGIANLPITTFYSINDDQFKGRLYWNSQLLFEGFLVQDDCSELMADYAHEITLSFNDNLGLLKDIALDENVPDFGGFLATAYFEFLSPIPDNFIHLYNTDFIPEVGVPFTISGYIDPAGNATWTPIAVEALGGGNWKVQVVDLAFVQMPPYPVLITGAGTIDLYKRNTLLNIIRVCLYNTGLELDTYIYANIFEVAHDNTRSFLEQTYVDTQVFLDDQKFKNCYEVLTYIMDRFNLTLFQSLGAWRIMKWDEARYYPTTHLIPYFRYDSEMAYVGDGVYGESFDTGNSDSLPENGLTKSIFRPYKFTLETFNYRQPKYLLRNFDLQELGALLGTYIDGATTVNEYAFTGWGDGGYSPQPLYYIRVVTDTLTGDEIERYAVVEDATGDTARSVMATPFEVNEGDRVNLQFTFRTNVSQAGPATIVLALRLFDGTTTNYADEDNTVNWKTGLGWNYLVPSGSDTNVNQSVEIDPGPIPFSGLMFVYLPQAVNSAGTGDETQIKDIRLTYTPFINDSTKIIGHTHTGEQTPNTKNNLSEDIYLDDSPRNSNAGTLFLPGFDGLLQERTSEWYRLTSPSEELKLGNITTFEQLFWRRLSRTKLEGNVIGLIKVGVHVSMLSILSFSELPGLNFGFGMLEIDYKNQSFNGNQWELCTDSEEDADLTSTYTFNYLYDSR
jgi:hypothetical protein